MAEEILTPVDAGQVSAEGSQATTPATDTGAIVEAAAPQQKPIQTAEENAKYAEVRRKAEAESRQKALDEFISREGYEYNGKPITTYTEYQRIKEQIEADQKKAQYKEQYGIDPDSVKPLFQQWKETDPDFQELRAIKQEKNVNQALQDLNTELKDNGLDLQLNALTAEELQKLPNIDKIAENVKKGHSLADAFWLANKKDILSKQTQAAQQEAIKKVAANAQSTPGSLSAPATEGEAFFSPEQVDKMSAEDIKKNYSAVMKSMKKWK